MLHIPVTEVQHLAWEKADCGASSAAAAASGSALSPCHPASVSPRTHSCSVAAASPLRAAAATTVDELAASPADELLS